MSRTTTGNLGVPQLRMLRMIASFFIAALLICLYAQNAQAAVNPGQADQALVDYDLSGDGLIISTARGWTRQTYSYYESNKKHLMLGTLHETGTLSVQSGKTFTFEDGDETLDGGAVYIAEKQYKFEAVYDTTGNTTTGTLEFKNNTTTQSGGAIFITEKLSPDPNDPTRLTLRGTSGLNNYYLADDNLDVDADHENAVPDLSVIFEGNKAGVLGTQADSFGGGAIYNRGATIDIENVRFGANLDMNEVIRKNSANSTVQSGGAINNGGGTINLFAQYPSYFNNDPVNYASPRNIIANKNSTVNSTTGDGFTNSNPMSRNVFNGNKANMYGGAIYTKSGTINFASTSDMTIGQYTNEVNNANNTSRPNYAFGVMHSWATDAAIFHNNTADLSGGAIYNDQSTLEFNAVSEITNPSVHEARSVPSSLLADSRQHIIINSSANAGVFQNNAAGIAGQTGHGGGIYHNPSSSSSVLRFSATAGEALANSLATATEPGGGMHGTADSTVEVRTSANGGIFQGNYTSSASAGDGGAFYNNGGTLEFIASAVGATATATATATANGKDPTGIEESLAKSQAIATTNANAAAFDGNKAGYDPTNTTALLTGRGGALFNAQITSTTGGTITFQAETVSASATGVSTANSNPGGYGSVASSYSLAIAKAYASGADFVDNRAKLGGGIYNQKGILNFIVIEGDHRNISNTAISMTNDGSGGTHTESRSLAVERSYAATFTENKAEKGGAIYSEGGVMNFTTNETATTTSLADSNQEINKNKEGDPVRYSVENLSTIDADTITEILVGERPIGSGRALGHSISVSDTAAALFVRNKATNTGNATDLSTGHGGAIYNQVLRNPDESFIFDSPLNPGGGVINFRGITKFYANIADNYGGAIYNDVGGELNFYANASGYTLFDGNGVNWMGNDNIVTIDEEHRFGNGGVNLNPYWGNVDVWFNSNTWKHSNLSVNENDSIAYPPQNTVTWNVVPSWQGIFGTLRGASVPNTSLITTKLGGAIYNAGTQTDSRENVVPGGIIIMGTENDAAVTIPGINRRYGYFINNYAVESGGAIYNGKDATLYLTKIDFTRNGALGDGTANTGGDGGALYNDDGDFGINGGLFSANIANGSGGAIYFNTTNPNAPWKRLVLDGSIHDFLFENNEARLNGGAIYNTRYSNIIVNDITFRHNLAARQGGALWNAGVGTINNSFFQENGDTPSVNTAGGGLGAGIYNSANGRLAISGTRFDTNHADKGKGAAIYNNGGEIGTISGADFNEDGFVDDADMQTSSGNTFTTNTAFQGGAIFNAAGTIEMADSSFTQNSAQLGAAIYNQSGDLTFNVTEGGTFLFKDNEHSVTKKSESIYFDGTGNLLTINNAVTFNMYDPMHWANGAAVEIKHSGTGEWNLAGKSGFLNTSDTGTVNVSITSGTLTLKRYNYGTGDPDPDWVAAGIDLGNGNFAMEAGTTLNVYGSAHNSEYVTVEQTDASSIATTGAIKLDGNVVFNDITSSDLYRNIAAKSGNTNVSNEGHVLELGTIAEIGGTITVHLTGNIRDNLIDVNDITDESLLDKNWMDYFSVTENDLRLINNHNGQKIATVLYDDGTGNMVEFSEERGVNGLSTAFQVYNGILSLEDGTVNAKEMELYWTGITDGNWDNLTRNWFGLNGSTARTFVAGDKVLFEDDIVSNYKPVDQNDPFVGGQSIVNKNIDFATGVTVGEMTVAGSDYTFNLGASEVLAVTSGNYNGDSTVTTGDLTITGNNTVFNLTGSGAEIDASGTFKTDGKVTFGSTADNTNGIVSGTTIQAGGGFAFNTANDFHFDLTGAGPNQILTMYGDSIGTNAIGSGNIYVSNQGTGAQRLMYLEGSETLTAGNLMVWNGIAWEQGTKRGEDSTSGLNVIEDGKTLQLITGSGLGNTTMYWTGAGGNSNWDEETTPNWSGALSSGINVSVFVTGDRVVFADTAANSTVTNKTVVLTDNTVVDTLKVTGTGYTFDIREGNLTAINDGGTGEDNFTDPEAVAIDFGNGSKILSRAGNEIKAGADGTETIKFGTDTILNFDLSTASVGDTILTINGKFDANSGTIGKTVNINDLPNPNFAIGSRVILVDIDAGDTGENNGKIDIAGSTIISSSGTNVQDREDGGVIFALSTEEENTQLILEWLDAGQNTAMTWLGNDAGVDDSIRIGEVPYHKWGESDGGGDNNYANWIGKVGNAEVYTFKNGDTVTFGQEGIQTGNNPNVYINGGGVTVEEMNVLTSGYTFHLRDGGINAVKNVNNPETTGNIALRDSTVIVCLQMNELTGALEAANGITAEGTIDLADTTFTVNTDLLEGSQIDETSFQDQQAVEFMRADEGFTGTLPTGKISFADSGLFVGEFFVGDVVGYDGKVGYIKLGLYDFIGNETFAVMSHNIQESAQAMNVMKYERYSDPLFDTIMTDFGVSAIQTMRGTELTADALAATLWDPWEITHRRMRTTRDDTGWNTWGEGFYRAGHTSDDGNAFSYDFSRGGTMIGADFGANKYWHIGGVFGYSMPEVKNDFGQVEAKDITLGVYSKINVYDAATISSFFGYGYQDYKMKRYDFAGTHKGDFQGDAFYASVEFAKPVQSQFGLILPLVALDHQTAMTKQFTETGAWNQSVSGADMSRTMIRFGIDGKWRPMGRFDLMTRMQGAFLLDGDRYATVESHFPGSTATMSLRGVNVGVLQVNAGLSASGEYRQRYHWFMDLDGYLANRSYAVQGQVGLSTRW